jgi:ElaB/YqjD/DUF883 family membrane-anchored ribosome-binding protein
MATEGKAKETDKERTPEEIQAEIEETRRELGDTAAAVAEKADVKKHAKKKVSQAKAKATQKKDEVAAKASAAKEEAAAKAKAAAPASTQEGAQQATQYAQRANEQISHVARENPVPTTAAAGFAAGLLVGWLIGRR